MATSEIKRLGKAISNIAKNNGQSYSCVEILYTDNGYDKTCKIIYKAYINDIVPWLQSSSFNGLISVVLNHIQDLKESGALKENEIIKDNVENVIYEIDDLHF